MANLPAADLSTVPATGPNGPEFRRAMRQLAGAVSVVTMGSGMKRNGLTATSVTSLTAEPPCLLVCINRSSSAALSLREAGAFAVNVLSADQQHIADRFAGRSGAFGAAKYADADWTELSTGTPILRGALASIDCRVDNVMEWHTHVIVIGRVEALADRDDAGSLIYFRGGYAAL